MQQLVEKGHRLRLQIGRAKMWTQSTCKKFEFIIYELCHGKKLHVRIPQNGWKSSEICLVIKQKQGFFRLGGVPPVTINTGGYS